MKTTWRERLRKCFTACPCRSKAASVIRSRLVPRLEYLEARTLLSSSPVTFTNLETQPTGALSNNAPLVVPGLQTNVAASGNYHISGAVTVQNTDPSFATEVLAYLYVNGVPADYRFVSFGANSQTWQASVSVEANMKLNANDLVQVMTTVVGSYGSAAYTNLQDLRLIQFNDFPGSGPAVTFTTLETQPTSALSRNAPLVVPGLQTNVAASGNYHISGAVTVQNTDPSFATEVLAYLYVNGVPADYRFVSFGANSQTWQASVSVEANMKLNANDLVQVMTTVVGSYGSAVYSNTQDLRLIQFNDTTPPIASLTSPSNVAIANSGDPYTLSVTYTDSYSPVNASTLGNGNILVTGPGGFTPVVTLDEVDAGADPTRRTATYRITPAGGWSTAPNGTFTVSMQPGQVKDTAGNAVAAGPLGAFTVDTTAPTASVVPLRKITIGGGTSYFFTVTYADNFAVDTATLGAGNVVVTGPKNFSQAARLVSVDAAAPGSLRKATYGITPPRGKWTAAYNGTYTVAVQANQVADTLGNPVPAGKLGTFTVKAAADKIAPKAALSAPNVTTLGGTSYAFTVTYTDNVEVNVSTLDGKDIRVTGPRGFSQLAAFDHVDVTFNGTPRTATYRITPPGGAWTAAATGVYTVTMLGKQAKDTSGNSVAARRLGRFVVHATPPSAALAAASVAEAGAKSYRFTVTYSDNLAVNVETLDSLDILVTGPNGFSQPATFVGVNLSTNGTPQKATYRITPPGASRDASDNGTYTVTIQPGQVKDTAGNSVPSGSLGTFAVNIPSLTAAAADAAFSLAPRRTSAASARGVFASLDDWLSPASTC